MLTHILHQLHYTALDFCWFCRNSESLARLHYIASDLCWFCRNSEFLARISLDPTEAVELLPHGTGSARCADGYESPLRFFQSGKYQLCS